MRGNRGLNTQQLMNGIGPRGVRRPDKNQWKMKHRSMMARRPVTSNRRAPPEQGEASTSIEVVTLIDIFIGVDTFFVRENQVYFKVKITNFGSLLNLKYTTNYTIAAFQKSYPATGCSNDNPSSVIHKS
jgi:hypothetical protein